MPIHQKLNKNTSLTKTIFNLQGHLGENEKTTKPCNYYYIYGNRNNIAIWNLEKTLPVIKQIIFVIKTALRAQETILFIGTQNNKIVNNIVKNTAIYLNQPFITTKWISGLFTNAENVNNTLKNLNIENKNKTKKQIKLLPLLKLKQKPHFICVLDIKQNQIAIKEATKMNIPIIAFVDTDTDYKNITYPILLNSNSPILIKFFFKLIEKL